MIFKISNQMKVKTLILMVFWELSRTPEDLGISRMGREFVGVGFYNCISWGKLGELNQDWLMYGARVAVAKRASI